jgi:molybdopterin-synthase adenylyltransferase
MMRFTDGQLERYSRHILLKDVGVEGQKKIMRSNVLILGAGGLGSPSALYLAAAGVGTIGIVDYDKVELSNLQRQVIHFTRDIGAPKVLSASEKMHAINPHVNIKAINEFVRADTIMEILKGWDFVIDGTDNFASKFLINDACVMAGIPFSHGGILRFNGQTMTVIPGQTTCYRCVFSAPPPKDLVPTCSEAGILGTVAGMLGTIQATEVLKFILGIGACLVDRLLTFNAMTMDFRTVPLNKRKDCEVCSDMATIHEPVDGEYPECDLKKNM